MDLIPILLGSLPLAHNALVQYMYPASWYDFGPRVPGGPALRANVAGRIGNRVSPAESAPSDRDRVV